VNGGNRSTWTSTISVVTVEILYEMREGHQPACLLAAGLIDGAAVQ